MSIPLLRLDPDLPVPRPARVGDAGLDLMAREAHELAPHGGRAIVPTGFAVALPPGTAGLIVPRSGLAVRHGVTVVNAPGLIDSGYRGELCVVLINTGAEPYSVSRGDRIAQLVIVEVPAVELVEVETLDATERGAGRFGHSGR